MNDFLKFFDDKVHNFPMHLNIIYNKVEDYHIVIWKKNCANDYPAADREGNNAIIVDVQDSDIELAFAKAHVALKEWLSEFEGGY